MEYLTTMRNKLQQHAVIYVFQKQANSYVVLLGVNYPEEGGKGALDTGNILFLELNAAYMGIFTSS